MQITESQLRNQIRTLLKEEVYGKIATVYHGSKQSPEKFLKIFETSSSEGYTSTGWSGGAGGEMYGRGLYAVWERSSHQTFEGVYGPWLYKLKVNLHGFIIFNETVCNRVYSRSISPLEQLKLLGKERELKKATEAEMSILTKLPHDAESSNDASKLAPFLKGRVNGLIFFDRDDGPVAVIYDPDIVTPISWMKLNTRTKPKKVQQQKTLGYEEIEKSLKRSSHAGMQADPQRLQTKSPDKTFIERVVNDTRVFTSALSRLTNVTKDMIAKKTSNPEILTKLANDEDQGIKMTALRNENIPVDVLMKFSNDKNTIIRSCVADNEKTPADVLMKLANDKQKWVRSQVATNYAAPVEAFRKLATDKYEFIRRGVASHCSSPDILDMLVNDEYQIVRSYVAHNAATSAATLQKLLNDEDAEVKDEAKRAIEKRGLNANY